MCVKEPFGICQQPFLSFASELVLHTKLLYLGIIIVHRNRSILLLLNSHDLIVQLRFHFSLSDKLSNGPNASTQRFPSKSKLR